VTPAKARMKKLLFFCRPSVPVHFNSDPVKYTVNSQSSWVRFAVGCLPSPLNRPFMTLHVSERIIEIPFIFSNLQVAKGSTVVDLGCAESCLSLELANRGFKVLASDLRPYPFVHPNLTQLAGDFARAPVEEASVDAAIAVSTLEHVGLNSYQKGSERNSDRSVVEKVKTVLKPGGQFLATIPYGIKSRTDWYRVYDHESLSALLAGFDLETIEYYQRRGNSAWEETSECCAAKVASPVKANCVALIAAVVPKGIRESPVRDPLKS
jgi:2-polyprenyl-3-methyl-5-hydroxy-6-metoxy-1,4-benzoquinol methylase